MKPNFALSLSFEGISLLHRAFPGWNRVGDVALDSPDLSGALAVLRETAGQINGPDVTSKLVIPNDQIKYFTLDIGMMSEDERRSAIREALDGATPYPVDDLAFDWSVEGNKTHVAAVARETLAEAESFAESHGFAPVSFVAIPPEGQFSGEPFFGPTRLADRLLGDGGQVQRDMAAIRITGVVRLPDPGDAEDTPAGMSGTAPASVAPESEAAAAAPAGSEAEPAPDPVMDTETEPSPEPAPEPVEMPVFGHRHAESAEEAEEADEAALPTAILSDTLPTEDPEDDAADEVGTEILAAATETTEPDTVPSFSTIRANRDDEDEAVSTAPSLSGVRRGAEDLTAPTIAIPPDTEPGEIATPVVEAAPSIHADDGAYDDIPPMPGYLANDRDIDEPDYEPVAPAARDEGPREGRLAAFGRQGSAMAAGLAGSLAARSARRAEARAAAQTDAGEEARLNAEADREDERRRMTVFGARKPEKAVRDIGGKPRYLGLILSVVLLLFLAGVAAWASIFMDDGLSRFFGAPRQTEVVTLPPGDVDETTIEGDEAMVPDNPLPDDEAVETASLSRGVEPQDLAPALPLQPTLPHALTEREAQARYAVTGVWQRAPQAPQVPDQLSLDDLYVASIDPAVTAQDAVALPDFAALSTDGAMAKVPLPAARGSRFALDERGLVLASADGTLSPEGFLVFAGRPPVWPAALPGRAAEPQATSPEQQTRLSGKRPRSRPEGLIEQNERSNLGGLTRNELAGKRPKARPELPAQKIEEETQETGTEFAVAESRKPKTRPSNFDKLVESARNTEQTTEPTETAQVAAAVPRSQVTAPAAPSRANVAKAATVRNQLNLRKVNLIGVYGKPSSRRALVRLANGRYKKVKVGDTLDGGQVSAIGEEELRYTKSGRSVILKMPKG